MMQTRNNVLTWFYPMQTAIKIWKNIGNMADASAPNTIMAQYKLNMQETHIAVLKNITNVGFKITVWEATQRKDSGPNANQAGGQPPDWSQVSGCLAGPFVLGMQYDDMVSANGTLNTGETPVKLYGTVPAYLVGAPYGATPQMSAAFCAGFKLRRLKTKRLLPGKIMKTKVSDSWHEWNVTYLNFADNIALKGSKALFYQIDPDPTTDNGGDTNTDIFGLSCAMHHVWRIQPCLYQQYGMDWQAAGKTVLDPDGGASSALAYAQPMGTVVASMESGRDNLASASAYWARA